MLYLHYVKLLIQLIMALNPVKRQERLDNPIERTNPVNEPDYQHEEGYNPFELTAPAVYTARYGEVTVVSVTDTVPADRHLVTEGIKSFMDQIQDRVMNEMRAYVDYFHVPLRCIFPYNYDKIIPNPTKGDDVPLKALPAVPLAHFFRQFFNSSAILSFERTLYGDIGVDLNSSAIGDILDERTIIDAFIDGFDTEGFQVWASLVTQNINLGAFLYLCFALSRGQLLDNLDFSLDSTPLEQFHNYETYKSEFQMHIDGVFNRLLNMYSFIDYNSGETNLGFVPFIKGIDLSEAGDNGLLSNNYDASSFFSTVAGAYTKVAYIPNVQNTESGVVSDFNLSSFRAALYDCFEKGLFPMIGGISLNPEANLLAVPMGFDSEMKSHYDFFSMYFDAFPLENVNENDFDAFFDAGFINPSRVVAYQQIVAEHMTSDVVDNVFSADLWMQNIRAIMFPSQDGLTQEPTFEYNGVDYEYDLFTTGAWERAWFSDWSADNGFLTRLLPFVSNVFFQRRSLRFKDYFASARPNVLAVGDLTIPVNDGTVSPIDTTRGIIFQRFYNAVNRWGMKAKKYMASLFGVVPTDGDIKPSYIVRRVTQISSDTVNNTANNQGKVSTNLVSTTSDFAFDVFLDDYGILMGLYTLDVVPYYPAGIDRSYRCIDRFSLYNPMLQNIGDQEIRRDEYTGDIVYSPDAPFGYVTRYGHLKQGIARAHGGFVNDIPAMAFVYPARSSFDVDSRGSLKISPDFIRDQPFYLDKFKDSLTGVSPAQYYHFALSVNNPHKSARKIAMWPGIL